MNALLKELLQMPEARALLDSTLRRDKPMVTGVSPVHRAMLAAAMLQETGRPMLLLCSDETEAARLCGDLYALTGRDVTLLRRRDWQLRPSAAASRSWEHQRLAALYAMASGQAPLVVAAIDAAVQRCVPKDVLLETVIALKVGESYPIELLTARLTAAGYVRCQQVEGPGQFALRGGILDVFSPAMEQPVRCEFWDDELDAMGAFDVTTQRRVHNLEETLLLPAGEVLPFRGADTAEKAAAALEAAGKKLKKKEHTEPLLRQLETDANALRQGIAPNGCDRYLAAVYPEKTTALDYLPEDAILCVCEGGRVSEGLKGWLWQLKEDVAAAAENGFMAPAMGELSLTEGETAAQLARFALCQMDSLPTSRYLLPPGELLQISARQLSTYGGSLETAASDMEHYLAAGYRVVVLCGGQVRANNMQELLRGRNITAALSLDGSILPQPGQAAILLGAVSAGSEWPSLKLAVLTEGQLTESVSGKQKKPRRVKDSNRQKLQSYTDLTPGDLVVHAHHGIGRFVEMLRLPVDGVEKDYIKIAYAGSDCLYVPATSLDLVSKYIGAGGEDNDRPAKLNKLGGTEWAKTTYRAKAAAKELAAGLIQLYAQRQRQPGFAFSPDSPWQREFEDAFDYEETGDQLRAIEEIKGDMEKAVPMDRLLCGDVGYGKTEVALRAVMKCILDGKQAAILVPTTVLAQQHYATAINRFRSFPVTIEVLSRFKTPAQKKKILQSAAEGKIDLLIGTHALLQKGLHFKDLGLLVIDEEQRFGVTHKEKLKELSKQVDTLTLSATPIPRTLNMALSGIRDMSTIEMPPQDRQPVQTYVLEHDWGVIAEAIRRELSRGGQVYYLHNRVETIDRCAAQLKKLLGEEVSIAVAHGKLDEKGLSHVMQQFSDGEAQILVCTTIIETGIDIPNVNTLVIEDADRLGLAQLHQIRGRIGRSARRAYAYMTYRPGKILTEVAAKRLTAIREYAEFGSGFRIAMRDLEIRGAGNLLGPEQSGYMMSVGYDMYLQLLEEAVLEERGEKKASRTDCSADLTVSANLPESYIPSPEQRVDIYRRIAAVRTREESQDLLDEMLDRYGEPPASTLALLDVAMLRGEACAAGIRDISQRGDTITFTFGGEMPVEAVMRVCAMGKNKRRLTLSAGIEPKLALRLEGGEKPLPAALELVESIAPTEGA